MSNAELIWTPHPTIDVVEGGKYRQLTEDEMHTFAAKLGPEAVVEYFQEREQRIVAAQADPLRHGFELPHWAELREWILKISSIPTISGFGT